MTTEPRCKVCMSAERARCEWMLARRVPLRVIVKKTGLSRDSLHRHRHLHMPPELKASLAFDVARESGVDLERLRQTEAEALLGRIVAYNTRILASINQAEEDGDLLAASRLWGRLLQAWEHEAKLLGELSVHARQITNNFVLSPSFLEVRVAVVNALADHPTARIRVAEALQLIEARALAGAEGGGARAA